MPGRPPKRWMRRCTTGVEASGGAMDPGAVCGANWQRKGESERRAIVRVEETMTKKKKKHPGRTKKKHPKKKPHPKKSAAHRAPKRSKKKTPKRHRGPSVQAYLKGIRKIASGR